MRAGELDRSIVIERFTKTGQNSYGEDEGTWTRIHPNETLPARVVPSKGTERVTPQQTVGKDYVTLSIRWRAGVKATDRVLYDGQYWNITGTDPYGRREALHIHCETRSDEP